jgi:hypothetical protein
VTIKTVVLSLRNIMENKLNLPKTPESNELIGTVDGYTLDGVSWIKHPSGFPHGSKVYIERPKQVAALLRATPAPTKEVEL